MDKKAKTIKKEKIIVLILIAMLSVSLFSALSSAEGVESLLVEVNANTTSAEPGDHVNFTINITNPGYMNLSGVVVVDTLPNYFTYIGYSLSSGTASPSNQTTDGVTKVTLVLNQNIPANTSVIVKIESMVTSNASVGTNVNKVFVNGTSGGNTYLWESDPIPVIVKKPELEIFKEALNPTAYPGDTIQYRITVKNEGTGTAINVKVLDNLPSNWQHTGTDVDICGVIQTISGNSYTFNLPNLSGGDAYGGESCVFTYNVSVPYPQEVAFYVNKATVIGNDKSGTEIINKSRTAEVFINDGDAELVVNKEVANYKEFEIGEEINFSIEVSNRGYADSEIYNVTIWDQLPIGLNYSYSTNSTGGGANYTVVGAPDPFNESVAYVSGDYNTGTDIKWYFSSIPGKTTYYIHLYAKVMSNAPDGTNLNKVEGNGTKMNGQAVEFKDVAAAIVKKPKLEIEKTSNISVGYVEPGNTVEFTVEVKNPGTGTMYNVSVVDTMDAGWNYTGETGDCTPSGGGNQITFDCGNIGEGETKTIVYTAYVNDSVQEGTNWNDANASGVDGSGTNYTSNDTIPLMVYKPALVIVKQASIYDVEPGSSVVFTITVENPTYATAYYVNVTDYLPVGFEYVNGTTQIEGAPYSDDDIIAYTGDYDSPGVVQQNITWSIGVIPPKTKKYLTFTTHVKCAVDNGTFTNNATTKGKNGDDVLIQDSTYINMTGWKAVATIDKSVDDSTPTYYQELTYTLVIRNRLNVSDYVGANALLSVITDVLPKGLKYKEGSAKLGGAGEIPLSDIESVTYNNGSYRNGTTTVKWNFTENSVLLEPGEFTTITYKATVMQEIDSMASNVVNLTYLDPAVPGIAWCENCTFSTADIETIIIEGSTTDFTLHLKSGWNLISIPILPEDTSVDAVFGGVEYDKIFTYNNGWDYVAYVDGERFGTLDEIDVWRGYWIHMPQPADLEVRGQVVGANISLGKGWSLIGWLSLQSTDMDSLTYISNKYDRVFAYDEGWEYRALYDGTWYGTLTQMEPGRGYWVHMNEEGNIIT